MLKRILPVAILGAAIIGNTGCNGGGSFKKIHGIEYKIVKDAPGKNAAMGDIVEFNMIAKVDTMVLTDSRKQGRPAVTRIEPLKNNGEFQAVFPFLSTGDSAIIVVSCDTILKNIPPSQQQGLPPWLKKGNKITINLAVVSIKTMEEYKKDMEAKQAEDQKKMAERAAQQLPLDDKTLQDYFAKNNIKATKTASGLYYTVEKPGTGANIAAGQTVSIMYTGKTLDGKVFDSNMDTTFKHTEPLTFAVGQKQMIPGMDEGVALFKKGTKGTLYMPSPLAYGEQGPPGIGANAILIFTVEVKDVKNTPPPAPPAPQGQDAPQATK